MVCKYPLGRSISLAAGVRRLATFLRQFFVLATIRQLLWRVKSPSAPSQERHLIKRGKEQERNEADAKWVHDKSPL